MDSFKDAAGIIGALAAIGAIVLGFSFFNNPEQTVKDIKHFFNTVSGSSESIPVPQCDAGKTQTIVRKENSITYTCN